MIKKKIIRLIKQNQKKSKIRLKEGVKVIRLEPIKGEKVTLREFELGDAEQVFENW